MLNHAHRVAVAAGILALSLGLASCASSGQDVASTPTPTRSPSKAPTPTPTPTPVATLEAPQPPVPSEPQPDPEPVPPSNAVNNANYVSHATDTVNGGSLTGVEFTSAAGDIVCGITGPGGSVPAGSAICTPSTWKDIIPQVTPDTGPYVHAAVITRGGPSATYLYPDWFSQPARTIPVLPAGKIIAFEAMTCEAIAATIRCSDDSTGRGFLVSTEAVTFF